MSVSRACSPHSDDWPLDVPSEQRLRRFEFLHIFQHGLIRVLWDLDRLTMETQTVRSNDEGEASEHSKFRNFRGENNEADIEVAKSDFYWAFHRSRLTSLGRERSPIVAIGPMFEGGPMSGTVWGLAAISQQIVAAEQRSIHLVEECENLSAKWRDKLDQIQAYRESSGQLTSIDTQRTFLTSKVSYLRSKRRKQNPDWFKSTKYPRHFTCAIGPISYCHEVFCPLIEVQAQGTEVRLVKVGRSYNRGSAAVAQVDTPYAVQNFVRENFGYGRFFEIDQIPEILGDDRFVFKWEIDELNSWLASREKKPLDLSYALQSQARLQNQILALKNSRRKLLAAVEAESIEVGLVLEQYLGDTDPDIEPDLSIDPYF